MANVEVLLCDFCSFSGKEKRTILKRAERKQQHRGGEGELAGSISYSRLIPPEEREISSNNNAKMISSTFIRYLAYSYR